MNTAQKSHNWSHSGVRSAKLTGGCHLDYHTPIQAAPVGLNKVKPNTPPGYDLTLVENAHNTWDTHHLSPLKPALGLANG